MAFVSLEFPSPLHEACCTLGTEFGEALGSLCDVADALGVALREELIGIADQSFGECLGYEVIVWDGEVVGGNVGAGESCAGMTFAHPCQCLVAVSAHYAGTDNAMCQVGLVAKTVDARSIAPVYADVMQHCCVLDEVKVELPLGMSACYAEGSVCHLPRVVQQEVAQRPLGVVYVYYILVYHRYIRTGIDLLVVLQFANLQIICETMSCCNQFLQNKV